MNFETMFEKMFEGKNSNITNDLKLNLKKFLKDGVLTEKNKMLLTYSLSSVLHLSHLQNFSKSRLEKLEISDTEQNEALEMGGFVKMLNTYYKFRNFVGNHPDYNIAGLRMNAMARTHLTKTEFEVLAFAHSLLNGCEYCVKAHEQTLRQHDVSSEEIHDIARLTSILNALAI